MFPLYFIPDATMNVVQQDLAHGAPISLRIDVNGVPGVAFQSRPPIPQRDQPELAALGAKVSVDVRSVHLSVDAEFPQRRRLFTNIEGQSSRLVPDGDGFD